jgi:hypothetical protein
MNIHAHAKTDPRQLDRAGILISAICLVHCTAFPLALAAMQFWGVNLFEHESHSHTLHFVLALVLLGVGGLAFGQGYLRHRRPLPVFLGVLGTVLLFVGALNPGRLLSHSQEHIVTIIGTLILLAAHLKNRAGCNACPHPANP